MPGPLIPYINAPEISLGFLQHIPYLGDLIDMARPPSIKPFGTLVALGVYIGSIVTLKRVKERKLDAALMSDFIFWVVAIGFVVSHMLDAIFYHPQTVARDPLYLFKIWDGLSSYGGFIGGVVGGISWSRYRKKPLLEFADIVASAFPLAWVFGRSGCASVHDHPGMLSDAWYAVQFPCRSGLGAVCADGAEYYGRLDLGLIEMVLTVPLALACWLLWRRKPLRPGGFYIALTLVAYAPVRFLLDFLRVDPGEAIFRGATDLRYAGLTPAQWACFAALAMGLFFLKKMRGQSYVMSAALADTEIDSASAGPQSAGPQSVSEPGSGPDPGSDPASASQPDSCRAAAPDSATKT